MMIQVFIVAFVVSYLGSIPPGTLNISVMRMSMLGQHRSARFFSLGATLVEFIYAGVAVRFQVLLSQNPDIESIFSSVTGVFLIGLGLVVFFTHSKPKDKPTKQGRVGFKQGLVLGAMNPLAIPFWLAVTHYLVDINAISVQGYLFWMYLIGLSLGTLSLLFTVDALGKRFTYLSDNLWIVQKTPGLIFIGMGIYHLTM